jgi:hypothetical protein
VHPHPIRLAVQATVGIQDSGPAFSLPIPSNIPAASPLSVGSFISPPAMPKQIPRFFV